MDNYNFKCKYTALIKFTKLITLHYANYTTLHCTTLHQLHYTALITVHYTNYATTTSTSTSTATATTTKTTTTTTTATTITTTTTATAAAATTTTTLHYITQHYTNYTTLQLQLQLHYWLNKFNHQGLKKENSHGSFTNQPKPQAPTTRALCLLAAMSFSARSWVKERPRVM